MNWQLRQTNLDLLFSFLFGFYFVGSHLMPNIKYLVIVGAQFVWNYGCRQISQSHLIKCIKKKKKWCVLSHLEHSQFYIYYVEHTAPNWKFIHCNSVSREKTEHININTLELTRYIHFDANMIHFVMCWREIFIHFHLYANWHPYHLAIWNQTVNNFNVLKWRVSY